GIVDHTADHHGSRGAVGAPLGAEPEETDVSRIDVVAFDPAEHLTPRERVDAPPGPADPEAGRRHGLDLGPLRPAPYRPSPQPHPIRRDTQRKTTDTGKTGTRHGAVNER